MTGVFYVPLRSHGGGMGTELESAHEVNPGEENSLTAVAGVRTRNLFITSPALYQQAIPASLLPDKNIKKYRERREKWLQD